MHFCHIGYFSKGKATECELCPAGHMCDLCPVGHICDYRNMSPIKCPVNTYASKPGSTFCSECPDGTHQPLEGQTSCELCPAGYSCPLNSKETKKCSAGTYSLEGLGFCAHCEHGKYQIEEGQSSCNDCPLGHFCEKAAFSLKVARLALTLMKLTLENAQFARKEPSSR